jgi:uncharacterized membrane protein
MDTKNNSSSVVGRKNQNSMSKKENQTLMGVLAYLGPLVIVSYFMAKEDPFIKFHIKQGIVLLIIEIVIWLLGSMFWSLWMVMELLNFFVFVLVIIGIFNVAERKEKELPLVGSFSHYFSF